MTKVFSRKELLFGGACAAMLASTAACVASPDAAEAPTEMATRYSEYAPPELPSLRPYYVTSVAVPMRDGVELVGNLVTPPHGKPAPVVVSITPYGRHGGHRLATAYAQAGLAVLFLDVRGRGDSGGTFEMFYGDLNDTVDVIEWAARQPFSNGKVSMWGSSYSGYNQWMAAAKGAEGLTSITPGASVYPGWDFPMTTYVGYPYASIWTGFTKGRMANFGLFGDQAYWKAAFTDFLESSTPFTELDKFVGLDTDLFDEWAAHPSHDAYWRGINPSAEEMAAIDLPILSMTGLYDGAQMGAFRYYREHMALASDEAKEDHYFIIGPYDHAGVVFPTPQVGGLDVPNASGLVPTELHAAWYGWTMAGGEKPDFLKDRFIYYVMGDGANEWRYAASLDDITVKQRTYYLSEAGGGAHSVAEPGALTGAPEASTDLHYSFDPTDLTKAPLGGWFSGDFVLYDDDVQAIDGEALIFETAPFETGVEIIGSPQFEANIGIDTPDTDFQLRLYEVTSTGQSIYLSEARLRARYRSLDGREQLLKDATPQPYRFEHFSFASRRLAAGSKLRFVLGAPNSIYIQRNYNALKPVSEQTPDDALTAKVMIVVSGADAAKLTLPLVEIVEPAT